jgi:non-specific serine/threonine protein kinase
MRKKSSPRRMTSSELGAPSAHNPEPSALLAAFGVLSANDLYTMAPKESVIRGYDYYRQQRLHHYVWSPDRVTLTASVQGQRSRPYAVSFSIDSGFLSATCDCPVWDLDRLCKHVLCACFTTKNLLSPDAFRLPWVIEQSRDALRTELLGSAQAQGQTGEPVSLKTGFEIVIDARHHEPSLFLRRDGMKMDRPFGWAPTRAVPPELIPLLNASTFTPGYGEDPLLRYLRQDRHAYPLILETRREAVSLRWEPSVKCLCKTTLDVTEDQVRVRAVCLADGIELERFVRFRSFVIDLNDGRLLRLRDEQGWNGWLAFQRGMDIHHPFLMSERIIGGDVRAVLLPDESGVSLWQSRSENLTVTRPLREFQTVQIDIILNDLDQVERDLILTVNGRTQSFPRWNAVPEVEKPVHRLVLIPPSASPEMPTTSYMLRAECRWGDLNVSPSASVFGFFPYLQQASTLSAPLRAWKRKTVLYEAFFNLLSVTDPNERDRRIKVALHGGDFLSRSVMNEAQRILRSTLATFSRQDLRLGIHAERWELWPVNKAREALLYRIPGEVFGLEIFRGMQRCDEMAVDAQILFQRLPELLEKLTAAGIQLLYQDKPVQTSRWECGLDVSRGASDVSGPTGAGIDWFEIRPEIRCDGAVLDEAEWRTALQQGGFLNTERGLRVLDRSTLERLRTIVGLTNQDKAASAREAAQIVCVPRLQILDWLALRNQGITVSLPVEDEAVLARLLGFKRITTPSLPRGLQGTLRPYQQDGYGWLAFLYGHRFGACLADDMGLGKTLQVICLLAAIKEHLIQPPADVRGPHLVVVPTSLLFNWEQELARFAPELKVRVFSGNERSLDAEDGEVVLITYGLVRRHIDALERGAFHVIVFDEAQAVKNIHADTTGAVRRLKGYFRVAMTGTPLENHLGEYFSVIDLCLPGLLGEYDRFKAELKRVQGSALDRLLRRTRPFILRRTKAEILHDLPPKIESEVFLELTDRQKTLYRQTVAQIRSTIDEAYRTKTSGQAQLIALTAILKLRQVCLSPRLVTKREEEPSPKLSFLMEKLPVLLDEGHSALVFSQFTGFLDLVQEACDRHAISYHRLDGSTASTARKARVRAFQNGEQPGVFLLSLKAGGQGLNLTKATYVFHLDPWWNPAVENQASDRAHRIGQQRTVSIVRLLMRHSIEEKMISLKQRKLDLYEAVMRGTVRGAGQGVLTRADFEFLLSPGAG